MTAMLSYFRLAVFSAVRLVGFALCIFLSGCVSTEIHELQTALDVAIRSGDVDEVKYLLFIAKLDPNSSPLGTPLETAVINDRVEIVKLLLKAGARVDARDSSSGMTALMFACKGLHKRTVELLLKAGANVNARDPYGSTPLLLAIDSNEQVDIQDEAEIVKAIIEAGANVNARDNIAEKTALMQASEKGKIEIINLLLKSGANLTAKNRLGVTTLMCASAAGHTEAVKILLQAGADANAKDSDGDTPLIEAVWSGHVATVDLLIKSGADADVANKVGQTALSYALKKQQSDIVRVLEASQVKK